MLVSTKDEQFVFNVPTSMPLSAIYTFSSCGSLFDTYMYVYARSASGVLGAQVAACDDCGPCGLRAVLDAELVRSQSYYVMCVFNHPPSLLASLTVLISATLSPPSATEIMKRNYDLIQ